jgi:magnesium-transporting ATPase (P-type)
MRLIEAHNLRVEEAILTGESTVVDKHESAERRIAAGRSHHGSSPGRPSARAAASCVVATGKDTELGHINQMMAGIEKHRTPLLVQMDKLGKAIFALFWR